MCVDDVTQPPPNSSPGEPQQQQRVHKKVNKKGALAKKNTNFTNKVWKIGLIKVCKNRPFFERV